MKKLSDIVASIPEHFEVTTGDLYVKSNDPAKKCKVCALGGLALLGHPERFKPDESGEKNLVDMEQNENSIYDNILYSLGIRKHQNYRKRELEFTCINKLGYEETVRSTRLAHFIYRINDSAKNPIEAVTAALRKYGL